MKSLIALLIVIGALVGMCGSIWMLLHHRWPNRQIIAQFDKLSAADISRVDITVGPGKVVSVQDGPTIQKFIDAFQQADMPRSQPGDQKDEISFSFRDKRPPLEYRFDPASIDDSYGPQVAAAVGPYLSASN